MNLWDIFGEYTIWAGIVGLVLGLIFALIIKIK